MDEHLAPFTRTLYMDHEGTPTVPEVPGMGSDRLQGRAHGDVFANQSVKDTLARLAAESSDRIPPGWSP